MIALAVVVFVMVFLTLSTRYKRCPSNRVLVIYGKSDMKDLRLARSEDGGKTWSEPVPFPHTEKLSIYPGSLTALSDGRVVHAWNTWYADAGAKGGKSRFVQFSISGAAVWLSRV